MGLLSVGTPLSWGEAKKFADHVRTHGITQFLNTWERLKGRQGDELFWGDEVSVSVYQRVSALTPTKVEYMVVSMDNESKNAKVSLRQTEILTKLHSIVDNICSECGDA